MPTILEYALMAGRAYESTRGALNLFPTPGGWTTSRHDSQPSGFEAISFQRGSEIVISYAGTYPTDTGDQFANGGLAMGFGSVQLQQAVEYYLQVKAANPLATITLTGHSLGGGLAALVGVFFGITAQTFDQAPFARSAATGTRPDVRFGLRIQPVDATIWLYISAGVLKSRVFLGRSLSFLAMAFNWACE
jgi:hypothetical protein